MHQRAHTPMRLSVNATATKSFTSMMPPTEEIETSSLCLTVPSEVCLTTATQKLSAKWKMQRTWSLRTTISQLCGLNTSCLVLWLVPCLAPPGFGLAPPTVLLFKSLCKPLANVPGLAVSLGNFHSSLLNCLQFRLMKHTMPTHAMWGGSAMLTYHLVIEYLRHHEHTNLRPMFIDHSIAMMVLGLGFGAVALGGSPMHLFQGATFSTLMLGPVTYWIKL